MARTVSGVFHSIKTALPSFDFELSPATSLQHLQHGIPLNEVESRSNTSLPGLLSFVSNRPHPRIIHTLSFKEKIPQGRDLSRDLQKFLASRVETGSEAWIDQTTKTADFSAKSCILVPSAGAAELNWQSKPLSSLAEELFELLFPDSWITNGVFPLSVRTLLKEWTEERLQVMACDLWSLKSAVCCLRVCRAALAPGNSVRKVSREEGQAALQSALYKCFPVWMQFFIGSLATQNMVGTVNKALYEEHVNQQLFLNLSLAVTYVVLSVVPNT
ncbi:hypothetical protein B566_EDAN013045 [Ephemera danica]|nr:hypothetical protein B566_EDAN013045 [Ephemera danica]